MLTMRPARWSRMRRPAVTVSSNSAVTLMSSVRFHIAAVHVEERLDAAVAGVVHQHVDVPPLVATLTNHPLRSALAREVDRDREMRRRAADFRDGVVQFLLVDVRHGDGNTARGETDGDFAAESGRASRHQCSSCHGVPTCSDNVIIKINRRNRNCRIVPRPFRPSGRTPASVVGKRVARCRPRDCPTSRAGT